MSDTQSCDYKDRLVNLQSAWWKKWLNVQAPYRWNIRRIAKGATLEIGCGIGRNLSHLEGKGTGVDHNPECIAEVRKRKLLAFTPEEFHAQQTKTPTLYDNLLFSHVLEHMTAEDAKKLLLDYTQFLKPDGKVIIITPQEAGQNSDPTHVAFMDFTALDELAASIGYRAEKNYSFPFSRWAGKYFLYNEFVSVWTKNTTGTMEPT
jgi:2-polyprenyl-3-methyl-5-hydroxy-6-metoxy-1,4-benzoquinol methylase